MGFIPGMQGWYDIQESVTVTQHSNQLIKKPKNNLYDHFSGCIKSIWQNTASIFNKKSKQTMNRRQFPQSDKGELQKTDI